MRSITCFAIILGMVFPLNSMAYIDPGSGSALMSGLIGICVVLGMYIKTLWHALLTFMTNIKRKLSQKSGD